VVLPADTREVYLLLRHEGNTAEGHAGCNRFGGSVTVAAPDQLTFGPLRSTRMACPALATESSFLQALEATRRYRISGDTLRLYDASSPQPLARLEAVYLR
jgi:heat shock protein HslJ